MKKLIVGNWKMHMNADQADAFDESMEAAAFSMSHIDWVICPPYPYIANITNCKRGAQDCSQYDEGAYTGDVSAAMLFDMGCDYCIVGHSERRTMYSENDDLVKAKASQVIQNDMTAIICVGETLEEREEGRAFDVVEQQIKNSCPFDLAPEKIVIAYEPVWAIGTGVAATHDDVASMHDHIRKILKTSLADGGKMRILYGGSVKPENASIVLNIDNVNGALIGGASLKADDFIAIGQAVES